MQNQQHPLLESIDSFIEPLLKYVLQTKQIGISYNAIKIDAASSSCKKIKNDCFKLLIPYAGEYLVWEVLFDSLCPEMAPDFIFNDSIFLMDPDIDIMANWVPSLFKWKPTDDDALHKVLVEFLSYYKQHQIELLEKQGGRLISEYNTFIDMTKISKEDIEVVLLPLGEKPTVARFLIRIPIVFSESRPHCNKSQNEEVVLTITFHGPNWNRIVPQLYIPETLQEISRELDFIIPKFPSHKHLMDYVPEVKKFIEEKISFTLKCLESRRNFITTLIDLQPDNIRELEYDALEFNYITMTLQHRDFFFEIHFRLPKRFPKVKPQITLQSIYHRTSQGILNEVALDNIPYCSVWPIRKMVDKLLKYIENVVPKFQANSIKNKS